MYLHDFTLRKRPLTYKKNISIMGTQKGKKTFQELKKMGEVTAGFSGSKNLIHRSKRRSL